MGVALKELIQGEIISLKDLQHKILAVDTYNILYQFLLNPSHWSHLCIHKLQINCIYHYKIW